MKFSRAEWRGPVPSMSAGPIQPRLVVLHIMQGSLPGTDSWFHDPAAKVSAHFGTGKDGTLVEWVDATEKAWAQAAYNSISLSIENEGRSGDELTGPQIEQCAQVLAWAHTQFGIPVAVATNPAGPGGLTTHGALGATGGNHPNCPGAPIVAQLPAIAARAAQITSGNPTPPAPPPAPMPGPLDLPGDDDMPLQLLTIDAGPLGQHGEGCMLFDGGQTSEQGITHWPDPIAWDRVRSVEVQGSFPPADGYRPLPVVGRQQRDGFLCVEMVNGAPGGPVTLLITVTA